jgi:hypothetical protein
MSAENHESPGVQLIAAERRRHVTEEGFHPAHDDSTHSTKPDPHGLTHAAEAYAAASNDPGKFPKSGPPQQWPWDHNGWKPASPIRMLVKAGALIAAEIDRRLRAGEKA